MKEPENREYDNDRVALPLGPEEALRALLAVDPEDETGEDEGTKDGANS